MGGTVFDFDELEDACEAAKATRVGASDCKGMPKGTSAAPAEALADVNGGTLWMADGDGAHDADNREPRPAEDAAGEAARLRSTLQRCAAAQVTSHRKGRKPISRARAWFEIRRFFEAEPQKHYRSPNKHEWKTYYAKELILKATCERFHRDGFAVIDACLAPEYFGKLTRGLLLDAPEQAGVLEDYARPPAAVGWVGSDVQEQRERRLHELEALEQGSGSALARGEEALACSDMEALTLHDQALCDSCVLSLAHDRQSSAILRPRSKVQFLRFMKTYLHVIAENSMSFVKVRQEQKIPVQFCFGNIPALAEIEGARAEPAMLQAPTEGVPA